MSPSRSGYGGPIVIGLAFAFGWTPCIGPILAAILAVAASEQTVSRGASLLAVYSLGLGIPFIVAAFAIEPFAAFLSRFRNYLHRMEQVMGALLVLTGDCFPDGERQPDERVAPRNISGSWKDRVKKESPPTGGLSELLCDRLLDLGAIGARAFDIRDLSAGILFPDVHHIVEFCDVALLVVGNIAEHGLELHA